MIIVRKEKKEEDEMNEEDKVMKKQIQNLVEKIQYQKIEEGTSFHIF